MHVVNAEQTNSSAIVGGRVIAKLIRRLTPGDNPDVTLPMHLRARGFDHVPGVAGTLDVQLGSDAPASAVVVHDLVPNEADLWEWSQDLLTREVERLVSEPDSAADDAVMAAVTSLLGQRTAEMHLGLAGGAPGFEPERFSLLWQRSILQSLRASVRETQRLVRRNRASMSPEADGPRRRAARATATACSGRSTCCARASSTPPASASTATCTSVRRCGPATTSCSSTSRASPGRPIGERSIKRSPLTDVAGIVRSLDYAGRVALATSIERGRVGEAQQAAPGAVAAGVDGADDRAVRRQLPGDADGRRRGRRARAAPTPPTPRCCSTPTCC